MLFDGFALERLYLVAVLVEDLPREELEAGHDRIRRAGIERERHGRIALLRLLLDDGYRIGDDDIEGLGDLVRFVIHGGEV